MNRSWQSIASLLSQNTLKSVKDLGFASMTPVQAACIPHFLKNKDLAVEAVTGSGKTLAFVIPIMEILLRRELPLKKNEVGAIILTPTRELAIQIDEVVSHFLKNCSQFSSLLLIGGASSTQDITKFLNNGGHILIATPGRLDDLFSRKQSGFNLSSSVKALEVLVLDEADRLLDMGFEASINTILGHLPKLRRTGLFSATQTDEVENLIRAGLRNPLRITVKEKQTDAQSQQRTPSTLMNYYMIVDADEKFSQLVQFLRGHKKEKILLFFSTCACVDYFSICLQQLVKNMPVVAIHSKMKQKRNKAFTKFRSMTSGLLVCTDVMARGIDIPDVHWVIQYDPPSSASAFVHRCGRTARIGNTGSALVMLLPAEDSFVQFIHINQKVPLTAMEKSESAPSMVERLRQLATKDRAVYEKGMRAFVSFIQSYIKHECNMIFRLKDLDFGQLAMGFGLLRIPKMPELKGKVIHNFTAPDVDVAAIQFKDKAREKLRLEKAASGETKKKATRPPKSEAWSKQKERKSKRQKRKEKKMKKVEKGGEKSSGKKRSHQEMEDEADDLEKDLRLIKKLKKGKISKEQFDEEFIGSEGHTGDVSD